MTKYIPHCPTPKQTAFLLLNCLEAFFGGSCGGGKTDALLMAALQYVDIADYSALLLRKTFRNLALSGALMDRAHDWLHNTDAKWNELEKTWRFPSGASLTFGYLEHEVDKYQYQSAQFHFIAFDEVTEFGESAYRFLFSRLRRIRGSKVPLRMRCASNPGGDGHEWVKQRFIVEGRQSGRVFVPSNLDDNPHLDKDEYVQSLANLDDYTRRQLLHGDWSARPAGGMFKREWFEIVEVPPEGARFVRYWDMAASEVRPGRNPDWTAGCLLAEKDGVYYICDLRRVRTTPKGVEGLVQRTAARDGRAVDIYMEQEPGSSGKSTIDHYARDVLKGYSFRGNKSTGAKELRANPVSAAAENGNIKLVRGRWIGEFLDEIEAFPYGSHDDQVDALSGAFDMVATGCGLPFGWIKLPQYKEPEEVTKRVYFA